MKRQPAPTTRHTLASRQSPERSAATAWHHLSMGVVILVTCAALLAPGCAYHRAYVSYEDQDGFPIRTEGFSRGQRLGIVTAKEGGAIWNECTSVAEGALWVLMDEARRKGDNAIGEIRWFPDDSDLGDQTIPRCRKRWGFILLYPFLVTPLFATTRVEAQVYLLPESALESANVYVIPESIEGRTKLVETILADTNEQRNGGR